MAPGCEKSHLGDSGITVLMSVHCNRYVIVIDRYMCDVVIHHQMAPGCEQWRQGVSGMRVGVVSYNSYREIIVVVIVINTAKLGYDRLNGTTKIGPSYGKSVIYI